MRTGVLHRSDISVYTRNKFGIDTAGKGHPRLGYAYKQINIRTDHDLLRDSLGKAQPEKEYKHCICFFFYSQYLDKQLSLFAF